MPALSAPSPKIEVCVDTIEGLLAAMQGGADRVELCSSLNEGGQTPSAGLIKCAAETDVPCFVMIRPRAGDFRYSADEVKIMVHDIAIVRDYGLAGIVFGAEGEGKTLDVELLRRLQSASHRLGTTLHRVIDCVSDIPKALDQAIDLGFDRVLTSGAAKSAEAGQQVIARMVLQANQNIVVMPGAGISFSNIGGIANATGASEFHASWWPRSLMR